MFSSSFTPIRTPPDVCDVALDAMNDDDRVVLGGFVSIIGAGSNLLGVIDA